MCHKYADEDKWDAMIILCVTSGVDFNSPRPLKTIQKPTLFLTFLTTKIS